MSRTSIALPNLLAVAILAALPVASAWAQRMPPLPRERGQDRPPPTRDSLTDAVRRVERDTRGEVLSAERIQYDGRWLEHPLQLDERDELRPA